MLISAVIAILLFICFYFAYREGLRLGMQTSKGRAPKNPVTAVRDGIKQAKAEKRAEEALNEYEAFEKFDGYTDEERKWVYGEKADG